MTPVWEVAPHPQATPRERPGSFREHDIEPFPGGMKPPDWTEVPVLVHPFLDGNGRAGRLILNLLLVRLGYPPAIIYKGDRSRYLEALRRADRGDPGPLGEFLARAVLNNLYEFVVPAVAGPARLVPLPALATDELNANALRVASDGELCAELRHTDCLDLLGEAEALGARVDDEAALGLQVLQS